MRGVLKIGTSGIVLPGSKKTSPQEFQNGTRLSYYSTQFNSVEINSTFYHLPRATTCIKWNSEVNDDFRFTCKMWREVTHAKGLQFQSNDISRFMAVTNGIAEKKGCLLVQFPASITEEREKQVSDILSRLCILNVIPKWKICVEFRHTSWYTNDSVLKTLRDLEVSFVLHDMPATKTPLHLAGNPVFLRFHGPAGDYSGSYSDRTLKSWAVIIDRWLDSGKDVYVYFNNTLGQAFKNAEFLKEISGGF